MALLSRLLALSCDRHMRNAGAAQVPSAFVATPPADMPRSCERMGPEKAPTYSQRVLLRRHASNRLQAVCWVQ